jgi:hypothetical protein
MVTWKEFGLDDPELAERISTLFSSHKHHTMATLRLDGSPRISGTEVRVEDGELLLGMMPGTRRAADLRRDPRMALHSHTSDPSEEGNAPWLGDAKVSGRAIAVPPAVRESDGAEWFQIDLQEVVLTKLGDPPDHLVIESWVLGRGRKSQRR